MLSVPPAALPDRHRKPAFLRSLLPYKLQSPRSPEAGITSLSGLFRPRQGQTCRKAGTQSHRIYRSAAASQPPPCRRKPGRRTGVSAPKSFRANDGPITTLRRCFVGLEDTSLLSRHAGQRQACRIPTSCLRSRQTQTRRKPATQSYGPDTRVTRGRGPV